MLKVEELFKKSDFITLHMPLTSENKYMVGEKQLAMMKKNVRIVNCARGQQLQIAATARVQGTPVRIQSVLFPNR